MYVCISFYRNKYCVDQFKVVVFVVFVVYYIFLIYYFMRYLVRLREKKMGLNI